MNRLAPSRVTHAREERSVTAEYLSGIREGREVLRRGDADAQAELSNLIETCRKFDARSPVGQFLRGERDFWRNQIRRDACVTHNENGSHRSQGSGEPLPVSRELTPEQERDLPIRNDLAPQPDMLQTDPADAECLTGAHRAQ